MRSTNSFFTGLKFTRRSVADNLQFFRAYNRRFQEYHILVAAIVDEEKRLPLVELMQAVMNGLFKKKVFLFMIQFSSYPYFRMDEEMP